MGFPFFPLLGANPKENRRGDPIVWLTLTLDPECAIKQTL